MKYKSIQSLEMCFAIHLIINSLYCIFINEICRGKKTQQKNFLLKSEMFIDSIQKYESDVWSKMAKQVFAVFTALEFA